MSLVYLRIGVVRVEGERKVCDEVTPLQDDEGWSLRDIERIRDDFV